MKRIMDYTALKPFNHYAILNSDNVMIGWIKTYYAELRTTIEIYEFEPGQLYSNNEPIQLTGYNAEEALYRKTFFGVTFNDHNQITSQLQLHGLKVFNLTP